MTLHAPRLPFSLAPLIAEARRRARQRRVLSAAAVLMLGLAAGGTTLALHPFGLLRGSQAYTGPFEPGGMVFSGGNPSVVSPTTSLQAVSADSRRDAWIVGSVAWHWDGNTWRSATPPTIRNAELQAVAAVAPDDAWAAGWRGRDPAPNHALIEHWNGARWSITQLPRLHPSHLYDVSAAGPRSAWAVGATFRRKPGKKHSVAWPLLLRWDGASWRKQRLPWAYSSLALDKVVATGPASVWVISTEGRKSRIEHWNGSRWRLVHAPFGSNDALVGFSATAWNDAWAVGSYGLGGNNIAKYSHALAAHWNGRRWQITPVPNPRVDNNSAALVDVSAARPDDAWAIGESQQLNLRGSNGADGISAPVPYFLRWDGQNWRVMAGATPVMGVGSLAATKDGSAWAIGACVFDNVVMRWTKGAWAVASHPPEHWPSNRSLPPGSRRGPSCTSIPAAGS